MSAHTPGPWTPCFMTLERKAIGFHISGRAYGSTRPICETGKNCAPEMEANARLIAAAPDMLALLKELIDIEGSQPGTAAWAAKVFAAIAKAEGRTP